MIWIRKDLIEKELENDDFSYHSLRLHKSLISKLFHQYDCIEMCENYYDSEPKIEEEEFCMYLDYLGKNPDFTYSKEEHTKEEIQKAYKRVKQTYMNYETKRMEFCNWQEPFFEGNWGYTQKYVNKVANETLEKIGKKNVSKKNRLYIGYQEAQIRIYWYGRDFESLDYWLLFKRKKRGGRA